MPTDWSEHIVEAHRLIRDMNELLPQGRLAEGEQLALKAIHELARVISAINAPKQKVAAIFTEDLEPHTLPSAKFPPYV
jgi:hypothetical protein